MKKQTLTERFQQLAGLKPLYEISPELKARAAMAAKSQGRDQQANRFGKSYGREGEADDSAFKDFMGKELGPQEDYMTEITNIDVVKDGFEIRTYASQATRASKSKAPNLEIIYNTSSDNLIVNAGTSSGRSVWPNIKDQYFSRKDIGTLKSMIKIVNPESKLANTHWSSFKIEGAGVFK
jgi:hypothetical protein